MYRITACGLFVFHFLLLLHLTEAAQFTIDFNNTFSIDGKPFRYVSGSAHYFRMPRQYWRDRLRKMRAGGLNAISTYVEWSQHEIVPGEFNFDGDLDVIEFIKIAQEEGLYVILRPGPYICAERDFGGFPYWLLRENPDVVLRSNDPKYTKYVEKWMTVLLTKISPFLFGNGGPIIMVQVENEYGFHQPCDRDYTIWLRELFKKHVQEKAVLFTTDTPDSNTLKCGKIKDVYATVDFGPEMDVEKAFSIQRKFEPQGPLVNSEYYTGWITHWGEPMSRKKTQDVVKTLRKMLEMGANVNFYMYFGGTNFGFTAGANFFLKYQSDITSYDYDAPITEAGDLTEKYYAIKEVLAEFLPQANVSVKVHAKGDYGELTLKPVASLLSPNIRKRMGVAHSNSYPLTFENLNQNFGYLLYETKLSKSFTSPTTFRVPKLNDYGNIFLDGEFITTISRENWEKEFIIDHATDGQTLSILVENLGRINFGKLNEMKGICSNVTQGGHILDRWNMTSFELNNINPVGECYETENTDCNNGQGFYFYTTRFVIPGNATRQDDNYLLDSFLDVSNLTKGVVFINNINLGRYWSTRRPQYTLYVPGIYLKPNPEKNTIIVMEENIKSEQIKIKFRKTPLFSPKQN